MRIIFLNMWKGERREELSLFLKEQAPLTDVFCFQEFQSGLPILDEMLGEYEKVEPERRPRNDVIYVKKNIPLVAAGPLLQDAHGEGSGCYVRVRQGDRDLYICNIHGWWQPGDKKDTDRRLQQSQEILDFLAGKKGLKIVGGDFNLSPETKSVAMFKENGYRNLIDDFAIETTRNHFAWDLYPTDKQYFADYAFVSPEVVVKSFSVPQVEISDHLPLVLDID